MARQFTLRLDDAEDDKMDPLKKEVGINTDAGAIKFIIREYVNLNKRYLEEKEKKQEAERKFNILQRKSKVFFTSLDEFSELCKSNELVEVQNESSKS